MMPADVPAATVNDVFATTAVIFLRQADGC